MYKKKHGEPRAFPLWRFMLQLHELAFPRAEAKRRRGFDRADTVAALDALHEVVAARIVGGVDQIETGLIDRDGVERGEDADVRHARVLGHGTAVAVYGHIHHDVDENGLVPEIFRHRQGGIRHRVEEAVVVGGPELFVLQPCLIIVRRCFSVVLRSPS